MEQKSPVLITLDDDESIASVIAGIAERAGFDAVAVTTAETFFETLRTKQPDIVVLDLQMPGRDGVSMLRALADTCQSAGIMLITGMDERTMASAEQYGDARGLNMMGTLQKPFDPEDLLRHFENAHAAIRALTVGDLQQAIENRELVLYYQPTVQRFADGTWDVTTVEALLRWNHPIRGILTPDKFLSMGEEHGLSRAMTDFVIQQGIEQLKGWQAARLALGLRINISANLISDLDFPDRLETMLDEQSLDPELLTLEVTETGMLDQRPDTFDILTRLRLKNINLAIDDFGIGYSSLTQLFRMPFNEMKIDKSLVLRAPDSKEASIMVDALVSLAHKLNLKVCAEGVEVPSTLEFLGQIGCDSAQGFYISAPVAASDIPKVLERWQLGQVDRADAEPRRTHG